MKKWISIVSLLFFVTISFHSFSQEIDNDAKSPRSQPTNKLAKKAERKAQGEKAEALERKHQYKIQTNDVKKRMKKSKKESERINGNKKEFFLKRWFSKKQR